MSFSLKPATLSGQNKEVQMNGYFWFWVWSVILGILPGVYTGLSYCYACRPSKVDVFSSCFAFCFGPWVGTLVLIYKYDWILGWRSFATFGVSIVSLMATDFLISCLKAKKNAEANRKHWAEKNIRGAEWAAAHKTT